MKEIVQWTAPSPLWTAIGNSGDVEVRSAMLQPAILRFATDSFMEDFMNMMDTDPARLADFLALPETWQKPLGSVASAEEVPAFLLRNSRSRFLPTRTKQDLIRISSGPLEASLKGRQLRTATSQPVAELKLYQPAHQRFYMVAGCLVCRQAGLPDHAVEGNRQERVGFVVRRLLPRNAEAGRTSASPAATSISPSHTQSIDEYAFVITQGKKRWQKIIGAGEQLVKNEELLPLSPARFTDTDGRERRLFNGLIPVSKREAYMGAELVAPQPGESGSSTSTALPKTARKILFRTKVSEPWKRILDRSASISKALGGSPGQPAELARGQRKDAREQLQVSSWYVLLDLAKFLIEHVPDVWGVVMGQSPEGALAGSAQRNLFQALKNTVASPGLVNALKSEFPDPIIYQAANIKTTLLDALKAIKDPHDDWEARLENVTTPYIRNDSVRAAAWPPFLFPLADPIEMAPQVPNSLPQLSESDEVEPDAEEPQTMDAQMRAAYAMVDRLTALVVRAMPTNSPTSVPEPPLAAQKLMDTREGRFVVRFVYDRPLCGPLEPPEVSQPTTAFQMAGYFDPDAPARPIRIALPLDTSPAGLRKFDKNTAFEISNVLCGQMQRLRSLTFGDLVLSVLPWPFHQDLSTAAPDSGACQSGGVDIGMICSISIPIITICALLLLIIIVNLLDIVFRWMPYFFICFPVPGFKAKK